MTTRFEQTGVEVCERCEIPRAIGESKGYDVCRIDSDYASDGYPEPGQEHSWVRVTPPAAPTILPMGVMMAEREREMAVISEALDFDPRAILTCMHCGRDVRPEAAILVRVGQEFELRCTPCASSMAVAS